MMLKNVILFQGEESDVLGIILPLTSFIKQVFLFLSFYLRNSFESERKPQHLCDGNIIS